MDRYEIRPRAGSDFSTLELTEAEHGELVAARSVLLSALELEEKFNLLLGNVEDFELEILSVSLKEVMYLDLSWAGNEDALQRINRRVVNVLAAARLYIDQSALQVRALFGRESQQFADLAALRRTEYDANLGYRAMEALRNYVQHCGLPIVTQTKQVESVDSTDKSRGHYRTSVAPFLSTERLAEDGRFKKSVLDELRAIGDTHDIKPLLRNYIARVGWIHETLRQVFREEITRAETVVARQMDRYVKEGGQLAGSLLVVVRDAETRSLAIDMTGVIERRTRLAFRNYQTRHYTYHVATNY